MSILSGHKRRHLRSLWTRSKRSSSTSDDIPPKADLITKTLEAVPQSIWYASNPTTRDVSGLSTPSIVPAGDNMQSEATITFTQPGMQPPVYVVTSLSTPPWAPIELKPSKEKTPSGDLVFEQKFTNVAEGSYQYKIRIGEGHWVVDESKESGMQEGGGVMDVD